MWAALGAVGLWSTNAYVAGVALDRMSVGWLLLVQYGCAGALYAAPSLAGALGLQRHEPAAPANGARSPGPRSLGPGMVDLRVVGLGVVGLTGTIFLQYVAFALAPIVAANVLAYGWPLLAALWVAATRRTTRALLGAGLAIVGFLGVALIFLGPAAGPESTAGGAGPLLGYVAALGSTACMTAYTLRSGRLQVRLADLLLPATLTGAAGAAVLVVITAAPAPSLGGIAAAAYIGVGPMAAGYGLWTRAMTGDGAARLAPLGYTTPMLSTVLLLATGAPAAATTLVGIAVVLASSLGVLGAGRRAAPAEPEQSQANAD